MISSGGKLAFGHLGRETFDVFIYGLGFETRSTKIASVIGQSIRTLAIQMSGPSIHALKKNISYAHTRKHQIVGDDESVEKVISQTVTRARRGNNPIRIGFDISSVNRLILLRCW